MLKVKLSEKCSLWLLCNNVSGQGVSPLLFSAGVAKLADAPDLGSGMATCAGSSPVSGTSWGLGDVVQGLGRINPIPQTLLSFCRKFFKRNKILEAKITNKSQVLRELEIFVG